MHRKDAALLLQVRAYIDSNLHRKLPVAALCREFNTNKTSLQKNFREYSGLPLHAFLLQSRMEKAEALLRETDHPVKFVAVECGYKKVRSFNKAFKGWRQLSPATYRKGAVKSNTYAAESYTGGFGIRLCCDVTF
ncbi:AraC family transcriptional regulator [Flavitalea sp. BT771]|uniref:helix-turn-helix domain-containing protein n=1 Tax=Flavitalea sp. BT771 TaxID=3063329 RepID=UPI0026E37012|nr:AraC family transcriptional regulator [Flavitalea sp. BT771]MDO6430557.1 AraC family transcriptional regulator [Flavitalea sp. BT771]MDV6219303.1 AraC family transcriptional regulator [Flavitalea sp. BT771]